MFRIGLDGIVLRGRDAGSLRYFEQVLTGLATLDTCHQFVVFADLKVVTSATSLHHSTLVFHSVIRNGLPPALHQQLFAGWHILGTLDLLHSPVFVPPLSFTGKTVTTLFDLAFVRYPNTKKWTGQFWWRLLGRWGMQKANRIIALSESTRRNLVDWGIAAEKIRVVYPCMSSTFRSTAPASAATKYRLPDSYVFYLGTLEPRKNIPTLLRAFALAKKRGALPHALVIAGARGWRYDDIFRTVEELGIKDQVIFLGYVPDQDLPALYSGADVFAYLSWYEGFGFPVLEAMACGTPVLTSNVSALPEVVGDAGILVPPNDPEQAADAIVRVLADAEWRRELSARGLARAALFTQERFARGILQVYEEVLQS
ncbi:MAG: glycosyltransferase family 4 protein [Chloroflexi bacterium]|nr:glycosyltransferase family 4 protein [Chloroflexota bacterium]